MRKLIALAFLGGLLFLASGCLSSFFYYPHLLNGGTMQYSVCGEHTPQQVYGADAWKPHVAALHQINVVRAPDCSTIAGGGGGGTDYVDVRMTTVFSFTQGWCYDYGEPQACAWNVRTDDQYDDPFAILYTRIEYGPSWWSWIGSPGAPDPMWRPHIAVHEMGHAFGLRDHEWNECDVRLESGSATIMGHRPDIPNAAGQNWYSRLPCTMSPYGSDLYDSLCGTYRMGAPAQQRCQSSGGMSAQGAFPDIDNDTVPDFDDNCGWDANPLQEDRDRDGQGDACDGDDDGDGFTDTRELGMGTDRGDSCRDSAGHDAWPLDVTVNGIVNTVDVGRFVPILGTPSVRHDFNGNGIVNTTDVGKYVGNLGRNCLTELPSQLLDVAKAAEVYGDPDTALADGFEWATTQQPNLGSWMLRTTDDVYQAAEPEGLIYAADSSGQPRLRGVLFIVPVWGGLTPPDAFAGSADVWHVYDNFCINMEHELEFVPEAACTGLWWPEMGHVLFVWWDNVNGPFAETNPEV